MLFKTQSSIRGRFAKQLRGIKRQGLKYEPLCNANDLNGPDLEAGQSDVPPQLTEVQKVELFALTKILTSWTELESEYLYRGYQILPGSGELVLVTAGASKTPICFMSELGFGAELSSMTRRFGPAPIHLTPLDGAKNR